MPDLVVQVQSALQTRWEVELVENSAEQLARAESVSELQSLRDRAQTARVSLRSEQADWKLIRGAAVLRLRAIRKLGAVLHSLKRTRKRASSGRRKSFSLQKLGITRYESWRSQKVAIIPKIEFEEYLAGSDDTEPSLAGALRIADSLARVQPIPLRSSDSPHGGTPLQEKSDDARIAEYLLRTVADRIRRILKRKYAGLIPADEWMGIIILALARLIHREKVLKPTGKRLKAKFFKYCQRVADEYMGSTWNQQRRHERSVPEDQMAALAIERSSATDVEVDDASMLAALASELVMRAVDSLNDHDRAILLADANSPTGKCEAAILAKMLEISTKAVRQARYRAVQHLKDAYFQLAAIRPEQQD